MSRFATLARRYGLDIDELDREFAAVCARYPTEDPEILEASFRSGVRDGCDLADGIVRRTPIVEHAEAKGRESLAKHLAFETVVTIEDAIAILRSAHREQPAPEASDAADE